MEQTQEKTKVAIYVSDSFKARLTMEEQIDYLKAVIDSRPDLELVVVFCDKETDGTPLRSAYGKMKTAISQNKIDMVFCTALLSLGKYPFECIDRIRDLTEGKFGKPVKLVTALEQASSDTPEFQSVLNLFVLYEDYKEHLKEGVQRIAQYKRTKQL